MSGITGGIADLAEKITNLPLTISETVLNGIKEIFIPDTEFIIGKVEYLKSEFLALGVGFYDMSDIFDEEKPFDDIKTTVRGQEVVIVNMDIVKRAVEEFRPVIRGLLVLFLMIYNYNQFMGLIGQQGITIGSVTRTIFKGDKE